MSRRRWNYDTIQQVLNNEQPFIQSGYTGKKGPRKEGEIWEEKGIKWSIKNGVKVRINDQADLIRELVKQKCTVCGFDVGMLGNKMDDKVFGKSGKCFDCLQAEHTEMVCNGTFQKHSEEKMLRNKLSLAKEFKRNVLDSIDYLKKDDSKIQMVHQDGSITTFVGSQNEKLLKEVEVDLEKVNTLIKELEEHFDVQKITTE